MKLLITMLSLLFAVTGLCVWDSIHTSNVLNKIEIETTTISTLILENSNELMNLEEKVENLNDYWTKKMDILSISISRKDMQPISDYLQYLLSAVINNSKEDAITYSRLLAYNVVGLKESILFSHLNLL